MLPQTMEKMARLVHVREHERHENDGDVVHVDAHDREIDDAAPDSHPAFPDAVDAADILAEPDEPPPEVTETRQARDLALWKKWHDGGHRREDMEPLLKNFEPLIRLRMSPFLGRVRLVPDSVIEAEFKLQFVEALRVYDPEKSSLITHVFRYLDKAKRYIADKQNVGRIPENRIYKIKTYTNALNNLRDKLNGEPSIKQLSVELGWPEAEVKRMASESRADLSSHGFEEDPFNVMPSKSEEVLRLFEYELEGDERAVYQHLTGYGKRHIVSTGEIAKVLGMPDYRVSRLKANIERKLRKYLE